MSKPRELPIWGDRPADPPAGPSAAASTNIVVIGMGYVGIPCAALLADVPGFRVTGVQRRSARSGWKIDALNGGRNPFEGDEPGLGELIHRVAVEKGTFRVVDDIAVCREADVILIDVQTPVDGDRTPRYESLCEVAAGAGQHMKQGVLVVIESTVAPGTTQHVVQPILERESRMRGGVDFALAFSYERVMPGKLLEYLVNFPRVVGGIDEESTRRAVALYQHIVKKEIIPTDCLTAEAAKTVENTYRDVNIAFANEMALMCESLGVDVFEVRRLVNGRPDRHMHVPGAGVGGHCLPKDPWLLSHGVSCYGATEVQPELLAAARRINDAMPLHTADLAHDALAEAGRPMAGAKVAVLGLAYLEDSDDTRNTPALPLVRALRARGARVTVHDPYVRPDEFAALDFGAEPDGTLSYTRDLAQALEAADCAVLVTRHSEYLNGDLLRAAQAMRTRVLVDGRGCLDAREYTAAGIAYRGLGRGRRNPNRGTLDGRREPSPPAAKAGA